MATKKELESRLLKREVELKEKSAERLHLIASNQGVMEERDRLWRKISNLRVEVERLHCQYEHDTNDLKEKAVCFEARAITYENTFLRLLNAVHYFLMTNDQEFLFGALKGIERSGVLCLRSLLPSLESLSQKGAQESTPEDETDGQ